MWCCVRADAATQRHVRAPRAAVRAYKRKRYLCLRFLPYNIETKGLAIGESAGDKCAKFVRKLHEGRHLRHRKLRSKRLVP